MSKSAKQIFILVGPKGAGKSFLSSQLELRLGIPFLRVEPIWLALKEEAKLQGSDFDEEGQRRVVSAVDLALKGATSVVLESTGTAPWFTSFLDKLRSMAAVIPIRVVAPLETCHLRVKSRDASTHIPVSDSMLETVNKLAMNVDLDWAFEFENSSSDGGDDFVAEFRKHLAETKIRN